MDDQNARLTEIKQKIKQLVRQYNQLKVENIALKVENEQLLSDLTFRNKKIEEIQNKDINLHLSRALEDGSDGNATGLRQRLDEYIRELETVIAFLKD